MGARPRSRGRGGIDLRYYRDLYWPPDRRTIGWILAVLVLAVLAFFGWQALSARSALNSAADQAEVLQQQLVAGQATNAERTLGTLREDTETARVRTDGILWSAGAKVPWLGRNVAAVRDVSAELDRVADTALPPVVDLAGQLNAKTFNPSRGRVDLSAIRSVAPGLREAATALDTSRENLRDVDPDGLVVPLRGPVSTALFKIDTAAAVTRNADIAARLLPDMLGQSETRRYLLLNQNNAEVRSSGGIVGSFAVITAKNGRLSLGDQGTARDLDQGEPVVELTEDEKSVFPSTMATDLRNTTITPDFPRTAQIAVRLVERGLDIDLDGAVSVDPVALSYLLAGLGPVEIDEGVVLDQNNATAVLLNQVYRQLDAGQQDEFFERTNERIFDRLRSGAGDPALVLGSFVRAVEENRIMVWSRDADERAVIDQTDLAGRLARDDGSTPHVGIYIGDAAAGKMEYFLDHSTSLVSSSCLDEGRQVVSTTTDLTSNAPTSGLPVFVTGTGRVVAKGSMRLNVRLVAPFDGQFTSVRLDGRPITLGPDRLYGRNVARVEVVLRPGQRRTITANATSGPGQTAEPVLSTTPGISSVRNDASVASSCDS